MKRFLANMPERLNKFFKDYNAEVDEKVAAALFEYFYNETTPDQRPEFFNKAVAKYKMNFAKMTADLFKKSIFHNQEAMLAFVKNPSAKVLDKDMVYQWFLNNSTISILLKLNLLMNNILHLPEQIVYS